MTQKSARPVARQRPARLEHTTQLREVATLVETSITAPTDTAVETITETILTALQKADAQGVRFLPARTLYRARYGPAFHEAMRTARKSGRIVSRRVHLGNHQRRRFVALPANAGFLPGGAR